MRLRSYICSIVGILMLRFLDLYMTYLYTPDLRSELNPLVSLFGMSWEGFIGAQILILAFVFFIMFFYFSRKPIGITVKALSFNDFIYIYFFGKLRPWPNRIFSMPKNPRQHLVFNGFIFMSITVILSLLAIINNALLVVQVDAYAGFIERHYRTVFPLGFMVAVLFSVYLFFGKEYQNYQKIYR